MQQAVRRKCCFFLCPSSQPLLITLQIKSEYYWYWIWSKTNMLCCWMKGLPVLLLFWSMVLFITAIMTNVKIIPDWTEMDFVATKNNFWCDINQTDFVQHNWNQLHAGRLYAKLQVNYYYSITLVVNICMSMQLNLGVTLRDLCLNF